MLGLSGSWVRSFFLLAVQFNVNDSGGDLLHHVSDEVILETKTVRILLTCRGGKDKIGVLY